MSLRIHGVCSAALTSVNAYFTDTASKYAGKENVPICNFLYQTKEGGGTLRAALSHLLPFSVVGRCVPYLTYDEMVTLFCASGTDCGRY